MPRIILEDIKSKDKKTQTSVKKKIKPVIEPEPSVATNPQVRIRVKKSFNNKIFGKLILFLFISSIVVGASYWVLELSQKADVVIVSKSKSINYKNKQFYISKDLNNDTVNFEIMIVSDKTKSNITLTEPKEVSIKAEGSVALYNEFSTKPEKLPSGTFISDISGKAYKTDRAVIIPGYKLDGKKVIPGQVVVNITSFLSGEIYNGSPEDFHINSFKGTSKYNKIYGKLKSPLVGGASGLVYMLDNSNKSNMDKIARSSLREGLMSKVKSLVPTGYILYPDAVNFSYKTLDNFLSKTPNTEIEVEATLAVVLIKEKNLRDNVVKNSLPDISDSELREVKILGLDKLSFAFSNKDQSITKDISTTPFTLSGDLNVIWTPDVELLKTKLSGIDKNQILSILEKDPGIVSGTVKIFPPWRNYVPNDLSRINIVVK